MEDMFITPIQPMTLSGLTGVSEQSGLSGLAKKTTGVEDGVSVFKDIFENAINDVITTADTKAKEQYLLATGQTEDPHSVQIAASEAQLAVDMLVALRTKALEAYNEIMRISA